MLYVTWNHRSQSRLVQLWIIQLTLIPCIHYLKTKAMVYAHIRVRMD